MSAKRTDDIERAIKLRQEGKSLKNISQILNASKSSISTWVKSIPQPEQFTVAYKHKLREERLCRLQEERKLLRVAKLEARVERIKNKIIEKNTNNNIIGTCTLKDKILSGDGRWMVHAPIGYQGKKYIGNRYIYEHRLIIEKKIGRMLLPDEVVHHINGNKLDNREENLEIKNKIKHISDHRPKTKISKLICDWCGKEFERPNRNIRATLSAKYKHNFCCLSHSISFQHKEKKKIFQSSSISGATGC